MRLFERNVDITAQDLHVGRNSEVRAERPPPEQRGEFQATDEYDGSRASSECAEAPRCDQTVCAENRSPQDAGPEFGFLINIGSKDNDRQIDFAPLGTEGFQNSESIHMWHEQIEQDQVRIELAAKLGTTRGNQSST